MAKVWYLTKFFFYLDVNRLDDPRGDHALIHLVQPLFQKVKELGMADYTTYMRFSERGAHLRLRCHIDEHRREEFQQLVTNFITDYKASFPDLLNGEMQLSPVGQIINRKWANADQAATLNQPGDYEIAPSIVNDMHVQILYETDALAEQDNRLQDATCTALIKFVASEPSEELRKLFVRILMTDFMELIGTIPEDGYAAMYLLMQEWIQYFELKDLVQPYIANYHKNQERYKAFFQQRNGVDNSAKLFPPAVRKIHGEWVQAIREALQNGPLYGYEDGKISLMSLMRLFSFFHLNHNRLAIGIFQEIFWAYAMLNHWQESMTESQIQQARDRIDNIRKLYVEAQQSDYQIASQLVSQSAQQQ